MLFVDVSLQGPSNNDIPPTGLPFPPMTALHGAIQINSPILDHPLFVYPKAGISFDAIHTIPSTQTPLHLAPRVLPRYPS